MAWEVHITAEAKKEYDEIGNEMHEQIMNILVITQRDDNACYDAAAKLYKKYGEELFSNIFDKM